MLRFTQIVELLVVVLLDHDTHRWPSYFDYISVVKSFSHNLTNTFNSSLLQSSFRLFIHCRFIKEQNKPIFFFKN